MTTTPANSKLDLLWAEEFDQSAGTAVNPSYWSHDIGGFHDGQGAPGG